MSEPSKTKLKSASVQPRGIVRKPAAAESDGERGPVHIALAKTPPRPSPVFDTYWRFAAERQSIFHARAEGKAAPWTQDPILRVHKFTNAYRASDRVSQYLIRNVIYVGDYDWPSTLLRILLFKIFNKPATWELLESQLGPISSSNFRPEQVSKVLDQAIGQGASIYSGAYIMPSGPADIRQARKHMMHVDLLANISRGPLAEDLRAANSMERAFNLLLGVPSFGPFLAFQFLIDANYSPFLNFSEMDFVVAGPGARDGIRKCFVDLGDYNVENAIRWVTDRQEREFESRGLDFRSLWGRQLQLIDCQNLFCEVDKYARVAHPEINGISGRTRIKQRFTPTPDPFTPWFPPKWELNPRIEAELGAPRPLARIG